MPVIRDGYSLNSSGPFKHNVASYYGCIIIATCSRYKMAAPDSYKLLPEDQDKDKDR